MKKMVFVIGLVIGILVGSFANRTADSKIVNKVHVREWDGNGTITEESIRYDIQNKNIFGITISETSTMCDL